MHRFSTTLEIIGINPFVFVPDEILQAIFQAAGREKSPVPVRGTVNGKPFLQTLVKFDGAWRLYINLLMLKNSPRRIGERLEIELEFDPEKREIEPPPLFLEALDKNPMAKNAFEKLPPSRRLEIIRYLARLKNESVLLKNIERAIGFLSGEGRFVGRDKP